MNTINRRAKDSDNLWLAELIFIHTLILIVLLICLIVFW